jgi:hypothetical protein
LRKRERRSGKHIAAVASDRREQYQREAGGKAFVRPKFAAGPVRFVEVATSEPEERRLPQPPDPGQIMHRLLEYR